MALSVITCPKCESRIKFNEGDIIPHCVVCHTEFIKPDAVKVSAKPEGTVVQVEPLTIKGGLNG